MNLIGAYSAQAAWKATARGALLAIVAYILLPAAARALTTSWNTNSSGTFTTPANWDNGVPDGDDLASFIRPGVSYTVTFPGTLPIFGGTHYVNDRLFVGDNAVTFARSGLSTYTLSHGFVIDTDRGVLVQGPALSPATLNLGLSVNTESATIADSAFSQGTLNVNAHNFNVNGSNSSLDELVVGSHGAGTLNVTSGGQVHVLGSQGNAVLGKHSGSTGVITIDGPGSSWTGSHFYLGGSPTSFGGGTGTITVPNGGVLSTTGVTASEIGFRGSGALNITSGGSFVSGSATIANEGGSTGTVVVNGPGSTWTSFGIFKVGGNGTGSLTIENGGLVSSLEPRIGSTGTVTVAGDGSAWDNSGMLTVTGSLTIADGGSVRTSDFGGLKGNGLVGFGMGTSGTVTVTGAGSNWIIDNELVLGGSDSGTLNITGGGNVVSAIGRVSPSVGAVGTVNVDGPGSTWTIDGKLNIGEFDGGTLNITGGGKVSSGAARLGEALAGIIDETVTVDGPGSTWTTSGDLTVGTAQIQVSDGASVAVSGGILLIESTGRVTGDSLISGIVVNGGRVEPGLNPIATTDDATGTLDIDGMYIESSNGTLQIRLGGTTPGTGYDQLQVSGAVALAGALTVLPANAFSPVAGNSFDILDWGSLGGTFSAISLPPLAAGLSWDTSQLYTAGVLSVINTPTFAADFDEDGDVDGDDLTRWRNNFGMGTTHMQGDAEGDADVDGGDFLVWQRQLGSSASAVSANAPVPEPATWLLAIVAPAAIRRASGRMRQKLINA